MNLAHTLSRNRGWIWMGGVALVVAAAGVAWFVQQSPRVDVLELRDAPLLRTLQFSARVATLSRVDVGSTVTGRVAQVRVAEGAQVRQGEVLIQLETEEL
ncbi:MAG: biotin/lipoyl-binding protein, partial [Polaromonas sp.]|nr:biotin/lipoyl-binding protein [Polaromonas sp.]